MNYYNKSNKPLPYIVTDFENYLKKDFVYEGHYFSGLRNIRKGVNTVMFESAALYYLMKRKDFDSLETI